MELELEPLNFPSDQERPCVIAGPCSAETEEQVMTTAKQLAAKGCHMFRAGVWKPRTKPGGFEGNGETALPWMKQVKEETGMLTATEVATPEHVELALKYGIDILWVGARTSANPFAMQALADSLQGVDVPVLVKNPVNPDLELWIGACSASTRQASRNSVPSTADSPASTRRFTATFLCGRFLSSCTAAYHSCQSSATLATSVADATSSPLSVSRQWT